MMIRKLAALILLSSASLIKTADIPLQISLRVVNHGDNVTLMCPVSDKEGRFFHWYKHSLGYMIHKIASAILGTITISEEFNDSRFTITKGDDKYFLTIRNVSKDDEATYFCQNGTAYTQAFSSGTFLAVNDQNQQRSVHVKQSPKTESVQLGDSVTLRCSLLSKHKENRVQCPSEHSVYWFRAASGGLNPGVIYTHRIKSEEDEERSCSYSLSKTIQNSTDAGTYYCAVVTCGKILFGEGTKVETRPELDPLVLVLGVLLACCVTVISAFIFYVSRRKVCEHCKGPTSVSHHHGHDRPSVSGSNDLGDAAEAINYVALNFSTRTPKRVKNRESLQEYVYSSVEYSRVDQHMHPQHTS